MVRKNKNKNKKEPLPQSCSYKAWERHRDSLIGMCGCIKIRCSVRLTTPRKCCYIDYQQLTKHLNTLVTLVCHLKMHKSYMLFEYKVISERLPQTSDTYVLLKVCYVGLYYTKE